jgi:O-antigen/teichoic acid export membrane protein
VLTRPEYFPAAPYVGFLTYMHILGGFGAILNTGALMGKQLTSISSAVVAGAAINVCLNALLIPRYGIAGASCRHDLGVCTPRSFSTHCCNADTRSPIRIKRILAALGIQLILLLLGLLIPPVAFPLRVTLKLGALIVLLAAYLGLGLILPAELAQFFVLTRREIYKRLAKRSA